MNDRRKAVAADFDGVIHSYQSPWVRADAIPDPPVDGAIEWLDSLLDEFDVFVLSTRAASPIGSAAIRNYLFAQGLKRAAEVTITDRKPPALVYVDDRSWRFKGPGSFPTVEQIYAAYPWNKTGPIDPDAIPIDRVDIGELRAGGYIQEVNRRFFHPLGMALEVIVDVDGEEKLGGVWDYRDDPEGMIFEEEYLATPEAVERAVRIGSELNRRKSLLGFSVQPIPGSPEHSALHEDDA